MKSIGPDAMKELGILYQEYSEQRRASAVSDTTIQQRVFREAYEKKLTGELIRTGFVKPRWRQN